MIYHRGKSVADRFLVLYVMKNELSCNRFGVSVNKRYGNSVERHRFKRQLKEIARGMEGEFISGLDLVIIARQDAAGRNYSELTASFSKLAAKSRIRQRDQVSG